MIGRSALMQEMFELIATVDRRYGVGGQAQIVRVTPAGTLQLPAIGSVPAQGLTLVRVDYAFPRDSGLLGAGPVDGAGGLG